MWTTACIQDNRKGKMPIFTKTGAFLQLIETSNDVQVIVRPIKPNNYSDATNQQNRDTLTHAPTLTSMLIQTVTLTKKISAS
jgi:hypothetical protein